MTSSPLSTVRRHVAVAVAITLLASVALSAHDMWIEPTSFQPQAGKIIGIKLRVGQDLLGDPLPRDPDLIEQFISEDATGRKPVVGREGADPAGLLRVTAPGMLIVGYRSHPSPITLAADKFNQYLKDEGLDDVAASRAKRNQTGAEAREVFVRCAKSLISSGPAGHADSDRRLGFTLELISERNPYGLTPGEELPIRLFYEDKPLAGALVVAINRLNPSARLSARSDRNGRVRFRLPSSGMWLIKAVHMVPAPAASGAEWASFWASLTFQLGDAPAAGASR